MEVLTLVTASGAVSRQRLLLGLCRCRRIAVWMAVTASGPRGADVGPDSEVQT